MNREEKGTMVSELQESFSKAQVALVASPQGLTVAEVTRLRRELRKVGGEFKVAKNTLARLAVKETAYAPITDLLQGPNGFVFGYSDPISVAKVLVKYSEENAKLTIQGGVLDGSRLDAEAVTGLAKLPSREALIGQLLGLLQAPAVQLLRTIQEPGARAARLIDRLRAKAEGGAQ